MERSANLLMPPTVIRRTVRLLAGCLLAAAIGCDGGAKAGAGPAGGAATRPAQDAAAAVVVRIARVEAGRAPKIVRATGSFEARDVVTIGAKVAGRIVAIGPEVGDQVRRGALLARVEDVDYVLARDRAARALEESLAHISQKTLPEGEIDWEQLPMVERARLEALNAKSKYDRGLPLHARTPPLISDQDLADLKTVWDTAESGHKNAVLTAKTDLAQARTRKTELDQAEQRIKDTVHGAPDGGAVWLVAQRYVAAGSYVAIGAPLYRLVDANPLRLRIRVPERKMEGVVAGREAAIRLADEGPAIVARVTRLWPEVDPRTRTHEVEIEVPNPDFRLSVGAFAQAEITVGEDQNVPMIPETAVIVFAGIRKVFVPQNGKAAERVVALGRKVDGKVEITDGLKARDAYVEQPSASLVPGTPIRVEGEPANGK
jgi:RND family efflux transporter MFP subunit